MSGKRIEQAFIAFAREHDVTILAEEDWRRYQVRVEMRRGRDVVTRFIDYDCVLTFLPSPMLNGMYTELCRKIEEAET